jgi:cell division protease FtsH
VHLSTDLEAEDLSAAAVAGVGGSGADAERWVRGARRRARHQGRVMAITDLIAEIAGGEVAYPAAFRRVIAVHEAGHAVLHAVLSPGTLVRADLRRAGGAVGGVQGRPEPGKAIDNRWVREGLAMLLGGRAAEHEILGAPSGGAGGSADSDLAKATALAALAEASLGLGADLLWLGPVGPDEAARLLTLRPDLASRVSERLEEAYADARAIIRERRDAVEAVADGLRTQGMLSGPEIESMVAATAPGPHSAAAAPASSDRE